MATATLSRVSTTAMAVEGIPKAKMLPHKVRVQFVAKTGNEFNIRMSLHSSLRSMVDLDKLTNFKDVTGNEVSLSTFECDQERFKEAFSLVTKGGENPEVIVIPTSTTAILLADYIYQKLSR